MASEAVRRVQIERTNKSRSAGKGKGKNSRNPKDKSYTYNISKNSLSPHYVDDNGSKESFTLS